MSNYETIHNMTLEEMAVFFCYQLVDGFELLAREQRFDIEKKIRNWLQENDTIQICKVI